jgi:hypothetical protein
LKTWWIDMDKKTKGGIAALIGALLYGGAELLDMQARLAALEELHPEIVTGVPLDPHTPEEPAQEPESPEPTEEPGAEPESAPEPTEEPAEAESGTEEE